MQQRNTRGSLAGLTKMQFRPLQNYTLQQPFFLSFFAVRIAHLASPKSHSKPLINIMLYSAICYWHLCCCCCLHSAEHRKYVKLICLEFRDCAKANGNQKKKKQSNQTKQNRAVVISIHAAKMQFHSKYRSKHNKRQK